VHTLLLLQVNEALLRVISMLDGPAALFHPAVLSRILVHQLSLYVPSAVTAAVSRALQQLDSMLGLSNKGFGSGAGTSAFHHPVALLNLLGVASKAKGL
jgi:hypothetical protein